VNDDLGTYFDVYCSLDGSFISLFEAVNQDEWPFLIGAFATKPSRVALADYMLNINLSSKSFAMFAPMFEPLSVNIFAMMILVHLVSANLVFLTEYFGSTSLRKTMQYSKNGPIMFYMAFIGWDLNKINTSLGRFIMFIDVMLETVLAAYFIGSVTASTELGINVSFSVDTASDFTIGCRPSSSVDQVEEWGADLVLVDSTEECAALINVPIADGGVDACLGSYEPLAYYLQNHAGDGLCIYDETLVPGTRTGAVNFAYPDLRRDIDGVIAAMQDDGRMDALEEKWFGGLDADMLLGNDTASVSMEWWTFLAIGLLVFFLFSTMLHRLCTRSANREEKRERQRDRETEVLRTVPVGRLHM
ncbi:hypothetical protein KIPB_006144, partial [Kipferlia bialata]